jgi:hypothetical protein
MNVLRMSVLALALLFTSAVSAKDQGKAADLTFDDIKFDIKKDARFKRSMLPEKIEKLSGKHVRIRGYILPGFVEKGIKQFVLVRDNMECCFGPGAALYDCILVEMEPGKSTSFTVRPVTVEGEFQVREFQGPDGKHLAIYRMVGREVK